MDKAMNMRTKLSRLIRQSALSLKPISLGPSLSPLWSKGASLRLRAIFALSVFAQQTMADSYANTWGPEVGSQAPVMAAKDQSGKVRTLDDLTGSQGVLIFYNRSADW